MEPCETYPICADMLTIVSKFLFRQLHCWDFMGTAFLSCLEDTLIAASLIPGLLRSFCSPFSSFPWALMQRGYIVSILIGARNPTNTYSLYFDQLWISEKSLSTGRVSATLACWHRNKYIEDSKKFSPLGPVTSPAMGRWLGLQYQAWISSYCAALKSN